MPLYDLRCPTGCGVFEDVVCSIEDRNRVPCPDCDTPMTVVPPVVRTVGPVFSNALEIKQIGRRFESNEELRRYQRENNVELQSSSSKEWRDHKDWAREKCEKTAKKQGFRDFDDKQSKLRKANAEGRPLLSP